MTTEQQAIGLLYESYFDIPPREKEVIISHHTTLERSYIISHLEHVISKDPLKMILSDFDKRIKGYPLAYILGYKYFYQMKFLVDSSVLIPRPETEHIIDHVVEHHHLNSSHTTFHDVGTGSGNIIISLAKILRDHSDDYSFFGSDISHKALEIAKKNQDLLLNKKTVTFTHSDMLSEFFTPTTNYPKDVQRFIFLANLPYVDLANKSNLLKSDHSNELIHEPSIALWSDENGLSHYKKLLTDITKLIALYPRAQIEIYCEIDPSQDVELKNYIMNLFPHSTQETLEDYAHLSRVVYVKIQ